LAGALEGGADLRLIGGSTTPLDEETMTADLFFRLQVGTVRVPSLSERPEDIPVLFSDYVRQAAEQAGLTAPPVTPELGAALMAQDWPGNARSLMSAAMRLVLGMPEELAQAADLGLAEQMARVERSLLVAALGRQNGNASEAAKALKLPRKTFYDKLARYAIRPEDFRR
jgi:two-component system C4-dicarboxylate transport response regulator DctD